MFDQRQRPRLLTLRTGSLSNDGAQGSIDCAILNMSESGACLLLSHAVDVPKTFVLKIFPDRRTANCRVEWKSDGRVGVSFDPVLEGGTDLGEMVSAGEKRPGDGQ